MTLVCLQRLRKIFIEEGNFILVIPNIIPKDYNFRITIAVYK